MAKPAHMTPDHADHSASQQDVAQLLLIPAVKRVVADEIEHFFRLVGEKIEAFGVDEFRKNAWHNTLLIARR